jgi:hypothetical protein
LHLLEMVAMDVHQFTAKNLNHLVDLMVEQVDEVAM